jgi:hypothetical protein
MGVGPIRTTRETKENAGQEPYKKEMASRGALGRQRKPTEKAKEAQQQAIDVEDTIEVTTADKSNASAIDSSANMTALLLELIKFQKQQFEELNAGLTTVKAELATMKMELAETKRQVADQAIAIQTLMTLVQAQPASVQIPSGASPTYAAIARTPPDSRPSNLSSPTSAPTLPSRLTDTLYCTVDISRVEEKEKERAGPGSIRDNIEREIRAAEGRESWKCIATTRDPRNHERIRITARNEDELRLIKEAAQKTAKPGTRVMRDQLYPIKIDNANRAAILNQDGTVRPEAAEAFGKENEVNIAKIAWLSRKDIPKAYGSMVIYVTKGSDVTHLLQEQYFHIAGESAYTSVYEPRSGPIQCYKCQRIGHKAFKCDNPQKCGKCAKEGHHHTECIETIPKCTLCQGPHESFSRNCKILHPSRNA